MVDKNSGEITVNMSVGDALAKIKNNVNKDWDLLFQNTTGNEAELLYLSGMFSGAGVLALFTHGARKSIVFIKMIGGDKGTKIIIITGGSETFIGADWGRYKKIIQHIIGILQK